jgi:Cellulose biosynthesis protein BcsS
VSYVNGPWVEAYAGFSAVPDTVYGYAGATIGINHSLNQSGFVFRLGGGDGHYKYNLAPGLSHGVDFQDGEVMIGYQAFLGATRVTGFIGANVQDDHNTADPSANVHGTKWGIEGQGEIYTPLNDRWFLYGLGTISSVWNSYLVMGKVGYNITPIVSVGPEVMALGSQRFDATRAGSFVGFNITPTAQLILSGGYSWDERRNSLNDHSGAYGAVHIQASF